MRYLRILERARTNESFIIRIKRFRAGGQIETF